MCVCVCVCVCQYKMLKIMDQHFGPQWNLNEIITMPKQENDFENICTRLAKLPRSQCGPVTQYGQYVVR